MQEENRRARAAPVKVVKARCAYDHLMVIRQSNSVGMKTGDLERSAKHREFIASLNFHRDHSLAFENLQHLLDIGFDHDRVAQIFQRRIWILQPVSRERAYDDRPRF